MSKRNKNRPPRQNNSGRWLIIGGIILALAAGIWLLMSSQQSGSGQAQPISQLSTQDFHSLAFSPTEPETVFFGHHNGLLVSHNGGKDWQATTLQNADAMALALPLSNPQLMYAAGHDVFYKSTDGGQTWNALTPNLPGLDIHGFTVDPEDGNRIFAHIVGYGIFGSQDGGTTWTWLSKTVSQSTYNLAMGENSQTLYAAAMQDGLWKSSDGGKQWAKVKNTPDEGAIAVTYAPTSKRLYITTSGNAAGVYVSVDNGKTWVSAGLKGTLLAIAVSPHDSNRLIAINDKGQIYASRDNGRTWANK
jgi:photosystem II stability/assembly factor-like uncharacterized protein